MARMLAISSQVARGHVGLSAIVPALQALGHEVIALPTVLLSNHPGHAHVAGQRIAPVHLRRMLAALSGNNWLGEVDAVLTGYLPSLEHVAFAVEAVRAVRDANPHAVVLVDPILGDDPKGLYIDVHAAHVIKRDLLPLASGIKLNAFELGWLSGHRIESSQDAAFAVTEMRWPATVATSVPSSPGFIETVFVEDGVRQASYASKRLAGVPNGTGDLLAALVLGHALKPDTTFAEAIQQAYAGVSLAARLSAGKPELQLIPHLQAIVTASIYKSCTAP